jgi:transposase
MDKQLTSVLGIDVSKKTLDVTLLDEKGRKRRKRVANSAADIATLQEWLSRHTIGDVHVCMESTSVYWEEVAEALHEAGYRVSVVNPVRIKGYAMSQLRRSKTDPWMGMSLLTSAVHKSQKHGRHRRQNRKSCGP